MLLAVLASLGGFQWPDEGLGSIGTSAWNFTSGGTVIERPGLWKGYVFVFSSDFGPDLSHLDTICAGSEPCGGRKPGDLWWHYGTGSAPRGHFGAGEPVIWPSRDAVTGAVFIIAGNPPQLFALGTNHTPFEDIWPLWEWRLPGEADPMPPACGPIQDTVFVSGLWSKDEAMLFAVQGDRKTAAATVMWSVKLGNCVTAPALNEDGDLFVASGNESGAYIHAFDVSKPLESGSPRWLWSRPIKAAPALAHETGRLTVSHGRLFITTATQTARGVTAVDGGTGVVLWERDIPLPSDLTPGVPTDVCENNEVAYVATNATGSNGTGVVVIAAFDAHAGRLLWAQRVNTSSRISCATPTFVTMPAAAVLLVCASEVEQMLWGFAAESGELFGGQVLSRQPSDCRTRYGVPCGGCLDDTDQWNCPPSPPVFDAAGLVYVAGTDGTTYALALHATSSPSVAPTQHPTLPPTASPTGASDSKVPVYISFVAVMVGVFLVILALFLPRFLSRRGQAAGSDSGSVCDRYAVIRKLGSGAFGTVFLVRRRTDEAEFAMKSIACQCAQDREEALKEWQTISSLQGHPNMICVEETFMKWTPVMTIGGRESPRPSEQIQGATPMESPSRQSSKNGLLSSRSSAATVEDAICYVCIVMPYYPEGDLRRFIRHHSAERRVPEGVIFSFGAQIASLLNMLHARQPPVIHRDLKPENCLLANSGRTIVVTDFGLARDCGSAYCRTHAGTLAFIAPELWDRHYTVSIDLWGLGCILYAMATRRVEKHNCRCLWRESSLPGFQQDIASEVAGEGYSARLAQLVTQLLSPSPRLRPTAAQLVEWLGNTPQPAPQPISAVPGLLGSQPGGSPRKHSSRATSNQGSAVPEVVAVPPEALDGLGSAEGSGGRAVSVDQAQGLPRADTLPQAPSLLAVPFSNGIGSGKVSASGSDSGFMS